ncbi:PPK2 family polyphosphate kinase [Bacillota bacterium Meth-B3]|nr:PPK2 family polyphosphate kinase [Christensenellaceae bacterium]MEA5065629.1 PPK2 family polyphosphate kinase [Eubacteriales bacterium]MEA5069612.1 PPK2 family polyphosphate kinase [Christensenellaceae bacterium]
MKPKDYRYTGKRPFEFDRVECGASAKARLMKEELIERTEENIEHLARLQDRLYADGREGLVVVLQAMDAAGKDSTVKHVMSGLNPQGVSVYSFKAPTAPELGHDYLWRIAQCLPERGRIAIFNRSHYEDAVTVDVLKLYPRFKMPGRCLEGDFIGRRLDQICDFEEYLYENGIRMVKIFLNVSRDEQQKRLLERLDKPSKHWKFSAGDLDTRARWDDYHRAYERAINETATKHCPWYVIPADDKWFTRFLVSEAMIEALQKIDPQYPEPAEPERFLEYRQRLMDEQ